MNYEDALNYALNGHAVLFTGAGFSAGTVSIDGFPPPFGEELAHILSAQSCSKLVSDLKDAADVAIPKLTPDVAVPLLHHIFRLKEIKDEHQLIASIPWLRIYTTNYDDAIEIACSKNGKPYVTVTASSSTDQPRNITIINHINGFINSLDRQTLFTEFKLTNQSYQTLEFLDSAWHDILISDIQKASAVFFVGYTLYDIDIQRILRKVNNIRDKCFFIFKDFPDEVLATRVNGFGEIRTGGFEEFSSNLENAKNCFIPIHIEMNLDCFKIDKKEFYINDVKDRPDVFDLLTFGKLNKGKIFESIANGFDNLYFINRGYAKKIISEIEKGTHNIVIDSDIGNGKSILLESLKAYYTHKNTRCYTLKNENDKIDAELCEIYKNTEKQIIFIDGIHKYKDVFKRAQFQRPTNTFFVMAERTALAEIDSRFISEICGEDIYSVSVNRIEDDDLKDVITLLRTHGLLGIFSKFQDERCFSEFKENNLASFLNIILYLYDNSEHIKEKLYTIIEDIENKSGYSQLLAAIFIASFLRSDLNLNDILEITKMTGNKSIIFQSDSSVRQLVDTDYNTINAKSSILAQYILSNKMLPNDIISMLINIYEFCAKNKHKNTEYYEIIDELNRFSTIQRILSKENLLDESIIYFEAIKKYNRNERNPSFWLQYAIAHTVNNSYIRAGEFFKTAKSYLGKEQYGTKLYIDNYYARYLLQRCIHDHRYYDFEDFKTVKVIVNQQIIDQETLYYPYRIIVNYKTFYDNFKSTFTKEQKEFILNHCTHVIKNSKVPPYSNRNYYRIKESIDSLNLLISELEKEI